MAMRSDLFIKAETMLEAADARMAAAPSVSSPCPGAYWTPDRIQRWKAAAWLARLIADRALRESPAVRRASELARRAEAAGDVRAQAKAAAARVQMTRAVWAEAYGRYVAKHEPEFVR